MRTTKRRTSRKVVQDGEGAGPEPDILKRLQIRSLYSHRKPQQWA